MATNVGIEDSLKKVKKKIDTSVEIVIQKEIPKKPITNDIGEQIRYYRELKGLTQKELGKILKTKRGKLNHYERKEIKLVDVKFLKQVFKILDMEDKVTLPDYENFIINNQSNGIKKIMKDNGLNPYRLAKIVNIDDSVLKKWIRNEAVMSKASYNKIKAIYNI